MRRHDYRMMVEAGHSLSTYYAGRWIGEIDVPTTILCTSEDRAVRPEWQRDMAAAIPGATLEIVEGGGHHVELEAPARVAARIRELALVHIV